MNGGGAVRNREKRSLIACYRIAIAIVTTVVASEALAGAGGVMRSEWSEEQEGTSSRSTSAPRSEE